MKIALKAGLDPTLPDVSLEIGGKERQLAFDFAAIVVAEKVAGLNLLKAARFDDLSFTELRGLLYAALLKNDPTLTLEEVEKWINIHNMGIIQMAIAHAWFGSVSGDEAEAAKPGEDQAQAKR